MGHLAMFLFRRPELGPQAPAWRRCSNHVLGFLHSELSTRIARLG